MYSTYLPRRPHEAGEHDDIAVPQGGRSSGNCLVLLVTPPGVAERRGGRPLSPAKKKQNKTAKNTQEKRSIKMRKTYYDQYHGVPGMI